MEKREQSGDVDAPRGFSAYLAAPPVVDDAPPARVTDAPPPRSERRRDIPVARELRKEWRAAPEPPAPVRASAVASPAGEQAHLQPLDLEQVIAIVDGVAGELDALHAHGHVHGCLTPACVVLEDEGLVLYSNGDEPPAERAAYAAPEQEHPDRPWDGRADQYALALIAYELLIGRARNWSADATGAVVVEDVDLGPTRVLRPGLGTGVHVVLRTALSRDPGSRFATAGDFARSFGTACHGGADLRLPDRFAFRAATRDERVPGAHDRSGQLAVGPPPGVKELGLAAPRSTDLVSVFAAAAAGLGVVVLASAAWVGYNAWRGSANPFAPPVADAAATPAPPALDASSPPPARRSARGGPRARRAASAGARALGYVRVVVDGGAPLVLLDGRVAGTGSMLLEAKPGVHLIELRGGSYSPDSRPVRVVRGDTAVARFAAR